MTDAEAEAIEGELVEDDAVNADEVRADAVDAAEAAEADELSSTSATSPVLDELVEEAEVEAEVGDAKARVPKIEQPKGVDGPVVDAPAKAADGPGPLGAELEALRADLDERTRDLQRVTAEYANYRRRVERDRALTAEQTTGTVLATLLPVLDDLDRAREHGDLVGPFGSVAEQLTTALTKFGLTAFGEKGDPFDPTRHEAVAHLTSAEVTEPTCVDVMRRGYLLGDRLLRAALVAVADPE
nr:nucleotide exchange factor GrpE [Micromonospora polyrhachis]